MITIVTARRLTDTDFLLGFEIRVLNSGRPIMRFWCRTMDMALYRIAMLRDYFNRMGYKVVLIDIDRKIA